MADSTCDISPDFAEQYKIDCVPLTIFIDGKDYKDRIEITPDQVFKRMKEEEDYPTTTMPSPNLFVEYFQQAVEDGYDEIICICMSSTTSGSYQSGVLGREYFYEENPDSNVKINVVDSRAMSHGSAYLLVKAAFMREEGKSFDEIVAYLEKYKYQVKHFLSVDDLNHLIRSGRLSNSAGFIGKMLHIKPIMSLIDGKGKVVAKERGTKKVLKYYIKEFNRRCEMALTDYVIIGYTSDKTVAETLKEKLLTQTMFKGTVYLMQMGAVVGTHVGLGGLSMFFMEQVATIG